MSLIFKWDPIKANTNAKKHGITFQEASTVFEDVNSLTIPDLKHSKHEERLVIMGISYLKRLLVVVFTERVDNIRIISSRKANAKEKEIYKTSS